MSLTLTFLEGPCAGEVRVIEADAAFIGARPECDVTIDDPLLADWHARVFVEAGRLCVENFDADTGTYVGAGDGVEVVGVVALADGATLRLGLNRLTVHHTAQAAPALATVAEDGPPTDAYATVAEAGPVAPAAADATLAMDPGGAAEPDDPPTDAYATVAADPQGDWRAALGPRPEERPSQAIIVAPEAFQPSSGPAAPQAQHRGTPTTVVYADGADAAAVAAAVAQITPEAVLLLDLARGQGAPALPPSLANRARIELSTATGTREVLLGLGPVTLGGPGRDVLLPGATADAHLSIARHPAGYRELQSMGAGERPRLNGEPVHYAAQLIHADRVTLGPAVLRFVAQGHEPLTAGAAARVQPGDQTVMGAAGAHDALRAVVIEPDADGAPEVTLAGDLQARPRLRFVTGPAVGREVLLGADAVTVGTGPDATVSLDDGLVGAAHCAVWTAGAGLYRIEALDEDRPTQVNDARLTGWQILAHGDLVTVGASTFEFLAAGLADADPFSTVAVAEPRFLLPAEVIVRPSIVIGSDPMADVVLEDPEVEGRHALLIYSAVEQRFRVKDLSREGLWIGAHRVIEQALEDQDVIRIGPFGVAVTLEGFNCSLDISAERAPIAPPRMVQAVGAASPFATVFRLPARAVTADAPAEGPAVHRPKRSRSAPKWRPPADVRRDGRVRWIAGLLLLSSLAAAGLIASRPDGAGLADRPLPPVHASTAFATAAAGLDHDIACGACHTAGARPGPAECGACHADQAAAPAPPTAHSQAGLACGACHVAHPEGEAPTHLLAADGCAGCHPGPGDTLPGGVPEAQRRHTLLARIDPARVAQPVPASVRFRAGLPSPALHRAHLGLGTACFACHAPGESPAERPAVAASACLTCHGGAPALAQPCSACHLEHPAADAPGIQVAAASPAPAPSDGPPPPVVLVLLLLGLPLLGVFGGQGAWHAGRQWWQARQPEPEPSAPPPKRKKLIHINPTRCVACSSCVDVCPFEVLHLTQTRIESPVGAFDKLIAVVKDFDRCQQCGVCETECPTIALTRAHGPPRLIKMPAIDRHYHSNVDGLYLAGAVAGVHLVKNAANIGHRCVKHMLANGLRPGSAHTVQGLDTYDVIIVGAGPAGLSAAATCEAEGLRHLIIEKGDTFASMLHLAYPSDKLIELHPVGVDHISHLWLPNADSVTWPELQAHWGPAFSAPTALRTLRYGAEVKGVARTEAGFVVSTPAAQYGARRVIVAIGVNSTPRPMGVPGADLPKVQTAVVDARRHAGQRCVVVGGGNSAVEGAIALTEAGAAEVILAVRGEALGQVSAGNRARLDAACAASGGRLSVHYKAAAAAVREGEFVLKYKPGAQRQTGGPEAREPLPEGEVARANDVVFSMIGFIQPLPWLQTLGVEVVERTDEWDAGPTDAPLDGAEGAG